MSRNPQVDGRTPNRLARALAPVRAYLIAHLSDARPALMLNRRLLLTALGEFLILALPSFLFVLLTAWIASFRPATYLEAAIAQGIGPQLWNVIGCLSCSFFGIALLWPRWTHAATAARHASITAYGIGSMSFGLLFGQLVVTGSALTLAVWQAWLWGAGLLALFTILAFYNFTLRYLAVLASPESRQEGFLRWWATKPLLLRASASLFLFVVPLGLLIAER